MHTHQSSIVGLVGAAVGADVVAAGVVLVRVLMPEVAL